MKILGIGVDIVENSRITKSLKNNLFIKRIFSESEILIAKVISDKGRPFLKSIIMPQKTTDDVGMPFLTCPYPNRATPAAWRSLRVRVSRGACEPPWRVWA